MFQIGKRISLKSINSEPSESSNHGVDAAMKCLTRKQDMNLVR